MGIRRSGYVRIDVCDVLDELNDDDLLDECHMRKLTPAGPGETVDLDIVKEAYEELLRGRATEARVILERLLFPKWRTPAKCKESYKLAFSPTQRDDR